MKLWWKVSIGEYLIKMSISAKNDTQGLRGLKFKSFLPFTFDVVLQKLGYFIDPEDFITLLLAYN